MDVLTKDQRRRCMAAIGPKHTKPELLVRRAVSSLGFRYRLHSKSLQGKPDLVFPNRGKVIFVHGCFWHRHRCKKGQSVPTNNNSFWGKKLADNVARDRRSKAALKKAGWKVLTIWECETTKGTKFINSLKHFLQRTQRI
ncbi:MAG: very short patch repair endonuclease [Deltaproteobacteria bacterium]|nr:very short patch repair endonuclease [Deltaproteobacteria bacterium]